jgi:predicted TIM-barrel fold metal-dependent hydrolase
MTVVDEPRDAGVPYASGRVYLDADSHVVETPEWLAPYADPDIRDRLRELDLGRGGGAAARKAVDQARARAASGAPALRDDQTVMSAKGWSALGAFDAAERSHALDLLGFHRQLVFSTFAPTQFESETDLDLLYGGSRATTRAIVDFCAGDDRLMPVGTLPMSDPARSAAAAAEAIAMGCPALLVPSRPRAEVAPTHPDFDAVWAQLAEAGVPFMLHVGGGGAPIHRTYHRNGRQVTDWLGGGENLRSKDFMAIHVSAEVFLAALVLDGVFERFPALRGGCIELGAMWVVPWLRRLDIAQATFRRSEPDLALPLAASEYARRQLWFTPFPTEPVGWMIEQAGDDLFLFSSDYPHPEGGRDPLKRFEASMAGCSDAARQRFYAGNFADMMGIDVPPT